MREGKGQDGKWKEGKKKSLEGIRKVKRMEGIE